MGWGFIPSLDNAIGSSLYTTSGAKESAKAQFKYQMALQKDAQDFSKWQMANAHQQEIQDLQNAGLNPVLSAGGSGASAGVSMGSASGGSGVVDPIGAIGTIVGAMNSAKQTNANIKQIENTIENNTDKTDAEIDKINAETDKIRQDYDLDELDRPEKENNANVNKNWYGRHIRPYIGDVGQIISAFTPFGTIMGARRIAKSMEKNSRRTQTTLRENYNARGKRTGHTITRTHSN